MSRDDAIGQIERLQELRRTEAISDAEYEEMKERIISTGTPVRSGHEQPPKDHASTPPEQRTVPQVVTTVLAILLAVGAVIAVASSVAYASVGFAEQALAAEGQSIRSLNRLLDRWEVADAISGLWSLVFLATVVLFVIWTFMSYRAAASRGAEARSWGSGWAIGAWFIPIANLVLPKLVINEIDQMSSSELSPPIGERWKSQPRLTVGYWWWGTFVLAMLVAGYDQATLRLAHRMFIPSASFVLWASGGEKPLHAHVRHCARTMLMGGTSTGRMVSSMRSAIPRSRWAALSLEEPQLQRWRARWGVPSDVSSV